jgi:hypothetical protein
MNVSIGDFIECVRFSDVCLLIPFILYSVKFSSPVNICVKEGEVALTFSLHGELNALAYLLRKSTRLM